MAKVVSPHSARGLHLYRDAWWVALLAAFMAFMLWVWLAAVVSGLLAHGAFAPVTWTQTSVAFTRLLAHPGDPAAAFGGNSGVGGPIPFYGLIAVQAVTWAWAARSGWSRWTRWRDEGSDGLATARQLQEAMGEAKALSRLPVLRPSLAPPAALGAAGPVQLSKSAPEQKDLTGPTVRDVAVFAGTAVPSGVELYVPFEETVLLIAPPREGKTSQLIIPWILDFPGPVLATSSKVDVLYASAKARKALGPVLALDPTGLSGWPTQVQWSLCDGCEDFTIARKRAETLASTTKSEEGTKNGGYFVLNAQMLITCWLHAAALDQRPALDIMRWATSPSEREAVTILARHGRHELSRALSAQHSAAPEERSASWRTAEQSFLAMYDANVAKIFGGSAGDDANFSIEEWITKGGTVFLIGEEEEGSALAPIMAAFSRAILDTGKRLAARMPNGRLDPPLGILGDEIANVAPLPQIPSLMSVSGSQNIFMCAVLQNLAQAQERWGEIGVRKMCAAATVKIILGGISDEQELKTYSALAGEFEEDTESVSDDGERYSVSVSTRRRAVLEPADIRMLAEREGLVIHRRTPVTRVKFTRIHEGARAQEIAAATREALREANGA
ncbi:type IV secretory system conjugative DNA transfer family protein [Streptomyces sp. NPDC059994]|uniref:type IV secretory system conjugative DNA transfer family protein n=1 Tax=Streptomyces sp. NPDC059994 TaxID=3347029 RepID=UPI0036BBA44C